MTDIFEEIREKMKNMTLPEQGRELQKYRDVKDAAKDASVLANKIYDFVSLIIVPEAMEDAGIDSMKIKDLGGLQTTTGIRCSCTKENKEALFKWLLDNGHGPMIKEDVASQTLKAFITECIKEGKAYPPEEIVKIEPYTRATIVKR